MTLECLPKVLKDSVKSVIEIKFLSSLKLCEAIELSNNALSSTYNLQLRDKDGKITGMFVKYLKNDDSNFKSEANIYFNNEIIFYSNIVETFNRLRCDRKLPEDDLSVIPECIHVMDESEKVLILKSLEAHVSLDVNQTLPLEIAELILTKLGQFHAYSFASKDRNYAKFQTAITKLKEPLFNEMNRFSYGKLFTRSIVDAFKMAKAAFPNNSMYVGKLTPFVLNIFDETCRLLNGDEEDEQYKVITHGDLWINNIMCKHSDDNRNLAESVVFTDFQGCRYASPVHDLMFVMLVAVNKEIRDNHRNELIRCYHIALCEKLQELGSDPVRLFPFSALQNQLFKHTRFILAIALAGLPLYMTETFKRAFVKHETSPNECLDIKTLDDYLKRANANKSMKCKNKMIEIIMDVIDQGYI